MIVGETLAGIFLVGSFFASFFTGRQKGSQTCTTSFRETKYKKRVKRASSLSRQLRIPSRNESDMVYKTENADSKSATRRTLGSRSGTPYSKARLNTKGGMRNSLKCLLRFIRSACRDYDVEFDGVIINNLNDNDILNILHNFLDRHTEELVNVVKNELKMSDIKIDDAPIYAKINSIKNDIIKTKGSSSL
jgi:hypothetical protein